MKRKILVYAFFPLIIAAEAPVSEAEVGTGVGRLFVDVKCNGGGIFIVPNNEQENACLDACLTGDQENWRAYEFYCQEAEPYVEQECSDVIDLLPIDDCKTTCCGIPNAIDEEPELASTIIEEASPDPELDNEVAETEFEEFLAPEEPMPSEEELALVEEESLEFDEFAEDSLFVEEEYEWVDESTLYFDFLYEETEGM